MNDRLRKGKITYPYVQLSFSQAKDREIAKIFPDFHFSLHNTCIRINPFIHMHMKSLASTIIPHVTLLKGRIRRDVTYFMHIHSAKYIYI